MKSLWEGVSQPTWSQIMDPNSPAKSCPPCAKHGGWWKNYQQHTIPRLIWWRGWTGFWEPWFAMRTPFFVGQHHQEWENWLPELRLAVNSSRHETTGVMPALLALGRSIKGPFKWLSSKTSIPKSPAYTTLHRQQEIYQEVQRHVGLARMRQARFYNVCQRDVYFSVGDLVWVKAHPLLKAAVKFSAKLAPNWLGPAKVKKCLGPLNYHVCWVSDKSKVGKVSVVNCWLGGM